MPRAIPLTKAVPDCTPCHCMPVLSRIVPTACGPAHDRPIFVEIPQLICCFISTKREIPRDHAAPGAPPPRPGAPPPRGRPRTTLTVTTHHFSQRHWPVARV